jgi:lipopolysaccharide/colanic/teichoic acid biosynthesis glycosyltransferase
MKSIKNIRLGVGFLIVVGAPPYLLYDFLNIAQGRTSLFHSLMFIAMACLVAASAYWLLRLQGKDYARLKPLWERPVSFILLALSSPLFLIAAILIKLESPGPALYSQKRVGKNRRAKKRRRTLGDDEHHPLRDRRQADRRQRDLGGKLFTIYKLRSMRTDAEEQTGAAWSTGDHDHRVTKIGYYIRKTHIDELPQLFNVLMGQMSIIGPRPERPAFIAQLTEVIQGYRERLSVSPGITGLAQVQQEYDESIEDVKKKLQYDKEYIGNICLLTDIQIILQTIALIFNLFWKAFKKRTFEKIEPKTPEALLPESASRRSR